MYYIDRPEPWEQIKPQKHKGVLDFFNRDCCDEFKYLFLPSGNWNYNQRVFGSVTKQVTPPNPHQLAQFPTHQDFIIQINKCLFMDFLKYQELRSLHNENTITNF